MIRLYGFPHSTNMERVQLALAHKVLEATYVAVPPGDRAEVRRISGQDLVPVIDHDGTIVFDSMAIVQYLDSRFPDRPLYPSDAARRAQTLVFIDWFNRVWKVPPNAIEAELGKDSPNRQKIDVWANEMQGFLEIFEGMLAGRDYLMGEFSAADCAAWPFLRYAAIPPAEDNTYLFHQILVDKQRLGSEHPRLKEWILRVGQHPLTPSVA